MKTIVVYDTKHGSTRRTAQKLAEAIGQGTQTADLSQGGGKADLSGYDAVVLGGPVYAGSWSKRVVKFAKENQSLLEKKRFAAFVSGFDLTQGPTIMQGALPPSLAKSAIALASLGGAYVFKEMNGFERFIIKAISKSDADASSVDQKAIEALALSVKQAAR